ncbi:mamu class II histocompatibility antigen, DR alpha chain-like [Heteronotia binoei]|uniref:mamu class II histocompatibility antigen, DR alpha chain-like n=1 Tax=Heteronotia binoei TaxID=13085 RepID=UPI00292CB5CD|nr:mamu class II histocompatibility antigen, DR alpha chain-like [Heteronotia binoei]
MAQSLWLPLPLSLLTAEEVLSQVAFVQRSLTSEQGPSEFMFDFDGDEIFHVDLDRKVTVWRLPQFSEFTSFQAEGAQGNIAVLRSNLDILMRRSNNTPVENVAPKVMVYPEKPAVLEEPNVLICRANGFSPPVIRMTWMKNGEEVKATEETDFYPNTDNSFRKFSYLTFVPKAEDIYYCQVDHWGLAQPLTKEWNANMPEPLPETAENVVCGLGLAVGIVGIIVGTVLVIKSRQKKEDNFRRGPM